MTALTSVLPVAYRDVDAAHLRLSFALERREPLRVRSLRFGDTAVDLAILSASHQVLVTVDGRLVAAEAVACDAAGQPLPRTAEWAQDDRNLRFCSRVRTLTDVAFAATVARLARLLADAPCGVMGCFPGDDLAITGLQARCLPSGRVDWRTWHAYPATRELVTTHTTMAAEGPA